MKYICFLLFFIVISFNAHAQAGIGTPSPNQSAQLDLVSSDKGFLIPRISLNSTTDATTITNGNVNGLIVFNIQTVADVTPGFYYWFETKWNKIANPDDLGAIGVSSVSNNSALNSLSTTVNNVASAAVNIINSNELVASAGRLVSSVNGVNSTNPVDVLISANNGLTSIDGDVTLGGPLSSATTIGTTAVNTLSVTGLDNSATGATDSALVVGADGTIKKAAITATAMHYVVTIAPGATEMITLNRNKSMSNLIIGSVNSCGTRSLTTFTTFVDTMTFTGGNAGNSFFTSASAIAGPGANTMNLTVPDIVSCADGGNATQFNFSVFKMGNWLIITNNGNVTREYEVMHTSY